MKNYKLIFFLMITAAFNFSCFDASTKTTPEAAKANPTPTASVNQPDVNANQSVEKNQQIAQPESQSGQTLNEVQTVFDLEGDVKKETQLTEVVIAILKSDERVDQCFKEKGEGVNEAEWFAASEIDLNDDGKMDLIIKGKDPCLFGANQGPFWVFYQMPGGFQKGLSASGLQLRVLSEKENSFNKIEVSKLVQMKPSSEIYSFRDGEYRPAK